MPPQRSHLMMVLPLGSRDIAPWGQADMQIRRVDTEVGVVANRAIWVLGQGSGRAGIDTLWPIAMLAQDNGAVLRVAREIYRHRDG